MGRTRSLRIVWILLVAAFVVGGSFEVVDNLLGLRTLNFESSAPAALKIAKEAVLLLLLAFIVYKWGFPRITIFGIVIIFTSAMIFLPLLFFIPSEPYAQAGLLYFIVSTLALLAMCALRRSSMEHQFAVIFLRPVVFLILATQILEAHFAPDSLYFESNLLGLDRRAGIAVIPTTAGLIGVAGFASLSGIPRLLSLLTIAMANSSLSLLCLVMAIVILARNRAYLVLALPFIVVGAAAIVAGREGLDASIASRLSILTDSIASFNWFWPSDIGALATAKSVALAPFDSYIVDSFYLEVFHVCGILPGTALIAVILLTIYRRCGSLAAVVFAISGIGFLVLEAWIVWACIVFGLPRARKVDLLHVRRRPHRTPAYSTASPR